MKPGQAANADALVRKYGRVKWFGGHNKQTGRENHFGFVEDMNGRDVFLHKREWQGAEPPREDDFVTYVEEEKDGKFAARRADLLASGSVSVATLYDALRAPPFNGEKASFLAPIRALQEAIEEALCQTLPRAAPDDLRQLMERATQEGARPVFKLIAEGENAGQNYGRLIVGSGLRITDAEPWAALPAEAACAHEYEIAKALDELEPAQARSKCQEHLDVLPPSLLTYLLVRGVYTSTNQLGSASREVYSYFKQVLIKGSAAFPNYLQASYDDDARRHGGLPSNPVLRDIVDNLRFKQSLFDKSLDFIAIYEGGSARLHRNIETFILYHLFSLVAAANSHDVVYDVFLQRLWEALVTKALSLEQQKSKLHALFPSCLTMRQNLACEAVYWAKQNKYLCRGRDCHRPQVLPQSDRHYLDFSIYDWLHHYGINYLVSDKPQAKDFPIKLAGYINRLREIFPRLHCRCCGELMLPTMRYARTEYKQWVDGQVQTKEMAAAYRLTVFHCNNDECEEFEVGYYISHCVGFGCYHIIDSRELKQRCSHGRYVCRGCGGCCSEHGQTDPVGLCADCGSPLEVWNEQVRGRQTIYTRKYVKCSAPTCSFKIDGEHLPAKFSRLQAKDAQQTSDVGDYYDFG